jgi:hypothetical protein
MRDIFILFLHAIVTILRLGQRGGLRSVVAESVDAPSTRLYVLEGYWPQLQSPAP